MTGVEEVSLEKQNVRYVHLVRTVVDQLFPLVLVLTNSVTVTVSPRWNVTEPSPWDGELPRVRPKYP